MGKWYPRFMFIIDFAHANHNPELVVNGQAGTGVLELTANPKQTVTLDAAGSKDPDEQTLHYKWWVYEEAGLVGTHGADVTIQGEDTAKAQVTINSSCRANWLPLIPCRGDGVVHIILEVTDEGTPRLRSYRRVVLNVRGRVCSSQNVGEEALTLRALHKSIASFLVKLLQREITMNQLVFTIFYTQYGDSLISLQIRRSSGSNTSFDLLLRVNCLWGRRVKKRSGR